MAGTGSGKDAPAAADRFIYRQQALEWLRAEFVSYQKDSESKTESARATTNQMMQHWLSDPDLAAVRDGDAILKLPAGEQDKWKQLWSDVRKLHADTVARLQSTK